MDSDGLERLQDILAGAMARPAQERAAFLDGACGDNADLRAEAGSLLDHQSMAGAFLETPAYSLIDGDFGDPHAGELQPGDALGDCRVISLLGEGGMGEVYLADDLKLERRVAVKLLKRRLDDGSLARRFRHERRVLAVLTHPNIARLYDGGTTPEGRSYLVMEYVDGERLDRFCERQGLGVTERLALFRKVCAAVAYAHQNLVVHRDLKPANIRVTPEGEPKLLDFGIAKLLDPEGVTAGQADVTLTLSAAMTPEYASPEQIKGETITTASDVYSLGVILYELLTGQRPYQLKSRRPDELARAICEEEPLRPSTMVGRTVPTGPTATVPPGKVAAVREPAAGRRRRLAGDLDNIVAKALRKEPARRYASVAALSDDLRRHCEGLPVSARKDTLSYRTGKFVRRNKVGVAAGALVILALVAGLVVTTLEARRADRRFEEVRRLAHSILFEVEPQLANLPGSIPVRGTLVNKALEYLDSLSREAGNRRDLRRELAAAYEKVGAVQGEPNQPNLGDYKGALTSYLKASDLRRVLAVDSRDLQAQHELASCKEHIGVVQFWSNQTAAAEQSLRAALTLRRRLVAAQPRSVEFRRGLASVLVRLGDIPGWNGQSAAALSFYRQAFPILQALAQERPQDTEVSLDLARCLENTADAQKYSGDAAGATKSLTSAEEIVTPLARREPNNSKVQTSLWYILYSETMGLLARKATDQALKIAPRMLGAAQSLARSDPENAATQHNLAISDEASGAALMQAQRWQEALAAFQAALAIDARFVANASANGDYQRACGVYHVEMGRAHVQLGEIALAEADAQAAQGLLESAVRLDPDNAVPIQDLVRAYEFRGDLCEQRSEGVQARQWFQRALEAIRSHATVDITASDLNDWTALREKLTAKTDPAIAPLPSPSQATASPLPSVQTR